MPTLPPKQDDGGPALAFDVDAALREMWQIEDLVLALRATPLELTRLGTPLPRDAARLAADLSVDEDTMTAWLDRATAAGLVAPDRVVLESPWFSSGKQTTDNPAHLQPTADAETWLGMNLPDRWAALVSTRPAVQAYSTDRPVEAGDEVSSQKPVDAMRAALPAPVNEVLLQGDLSGIVPGIPTGELAALLSASAEIESRGMATTVRFTPASIARALGRSCDSGAAPLRAGHEADDLLSALSSHSSVPIPQPLEYLIRDTTRRTRSAGALGSGAQESHRIGATDGVERGAPGDRKAIDGEAKRPLSPMPQLTAQWLAIMQSAMRDSADIWLTIKDHGAKRLVTPLRYADGRLRALDPQRQAELTISVTAIEALEPVERQRRPKAKETTK